MEDNDIMREAQELFDSWWNKASKRVIKIEKQWLKHNEPNDPDDSGGGDDWHVNEMMHNGDAHENTYEKSQEVFMKGYSGEDWEPNMSDSLFCELNEIIESAYEEGKKCRVKKR